MCRALTGITERTTGIPETMIRRQNNKEMTKETKQRKDELFKTSLTFSAKIE